MELLIRLGVFLTILSLMLLWEWRRPFRQFEQPRNQRLMINFGLMLLNFGALRLLSAGGAIMVADYAADNGIGLFHSISLPDWLSTLLCLLILDCAIYFQHRIFHRVPLFWRLHRVHHSDIGFDVGTAVRFHPVEIVLSMYIKMGLVLLLGASPWTVVLFEVILNGCALFNHGNVRLPDQWDTPLRRFIITPDMHRIHHSTASNELNSNFGFSVPWWDRLFRSYCANAQLGQQKMVIGLDQERDPTTLNFVRLLTSPLENSSQDD